MATENLKVKITADASQANAEVGKFKNTLKDVTKTGEDSTKSMRELKSTLSTFKSAIKGDVSALSELPTALKKVAVAAGAVAVAMKATKALVSNAINVAAAGDEIKDNAQKVFMGTTAYQEWGYVLQQNGIELSALKMGMRKFAQEVAAGSDVLAKYGITATNVDQAFEQAIYNIQNMSSETEKIAAATELFGARALELFPILNMTNAETQNLMATYRAVGATMSNELIAASDVCTDSITEMKVAWAGLRNLLASYIIPIISKVVQWITLAIAYIRILLAAILGIKESFGGKGGSKKSSLPATTGSVAKNTGGTAKNLKKAAKHAKELKRTLMGIDELSRLAEKATAAASGGSGGGGGGGGGISVGGGDPGDIGSFDGIISSETLEKINNFREKVDEIKDKLHGAYLIMKGIAEIVLWHPVEGIHDIWEGLKLLFPDLEKVEIKWKEFKTNLREKLEAKFGITIPTWADVKKKWEDLKAKFTGKNASIGITLPSWSSLKGKWNNLVKNFKSKKAEITISFKNALSSKWNTLASKVNSARSKYAFLRTILPQFPTLAKGGILTAPTTAILGEYAGAKSNPEIATPQSLMYETIKDANGELVSAFASMTRQVIAAIEQKDLSVSIGDEQIARSAQRGNSAYKNRTGKALLTI